MACQRRSLSFVQLPQHSPHTLDRGDTSIDSDRSDSDSEKSFGKGGAKVAKIPSIDIDYLFLNRGQTILLQFSFTKITAQHFSFNMTRRGAYFQYGVQYVKSNNMNETGTDTETDKLVHHFGQTTTATTTSTIAGDGDISWETITFEHFRYEHFESQLFEVKRFDNTKKRKNDTLSQHSVVVTENENDSEVDGEKETEEETLVPIIHLRYVIDDTTTTASSMKGQGATFHVIGPVISFEDTAKFNRSECFDLDNVLFYHRAFIMQDLSIALSLHIVFFVPVLFLFFVTVVTSRGRLAKRRSPTSIISSFSILMVFLISLLIMDFQEYLVWRGQMAYDPVNHWSFKVLIVSIFVGLNLAVTCYMATMVGIICVFIFVFDAVFVARVSD